SLPAPEVRKIVLGWNACPMKCLSREMRSLFLWGEAYSSGLAIDLNKNSTYIQLAFLKVLKTLFVVFSNEKNK
ncbi:MAG: hypothetical protein PVH58_12435, partial [Desulfobacterales bacterium]